MKGSQCEHFWTSRLLISTSFYYIYTQADEFRSGVAWCPLLSEMIFQPVDIKGLLFLKHIDTEAVFHCLRQWYSAFKQVKQKYRNDSSKQRVQSSSLRKRIQCFKIHSMKSVLYEVNRLEVYQMLSLAERKPEFSEKNWWSPRPSWLSSLATVGG